MKRNTGLKWVNKMLSAYSFETETPEIEITLELPK